MRKKGVRNPISFISLLLFKLVDYSERSILAFQFIAKISFTYNNKEKISICSKW